MKTKYYIKVNNSKNSEFIQKELFKLGYKWGIKPKKTPKFLKTKYIIIFEDTNEIKYSNDPFWEDGIYKLKMINIIDIFTNNIKRI